MQLVLPLPELVSSMSQLDVAISSRRIEISVEGAVYFERLLPAPIHDEQASAKFSRKVTPKVLKITAPLV